MSRIRVSVTKARCRDTEDTTGADEFYLMGSVTDGEVVKGFSSKPLKINNGETKNLGLGAVFERDDVPMSSNLKVVMAAFDADSNRDWEEHKNAIRTLEAAVGGALAATRNPYALAAAGLIPFLAEGIGAGMRMDKDDHLGSHAEDFPVWSLERGDNHAFAKFAKRGGWYSSWDYTVGYTVHVMP